MDASERDDDASLPSHEDFHLCLSWVPGASCPGELGDVEESLCATMRDMCVLYCATARMRLSLPRSATRLRRPVVACGNADIGEACARPVTPRPLIASLRSSPRVCLPSFASTSHIHLHPWGGSFHAHYLCVSCDAHSRPHPALVVRPTADDLPHRVGQGYNA